MTIALDITPYEDLLYARLTGDYSLSEANDIIINIFKAVAEHSIFNVLVDCRKLEGEPSTFERFEHSAFAANKVKNMLKAGKAQIARFAYLGEPPLFDPGKFGETVAVNRGLNVMATNSVENALRWLGIDLTENHPLLKMTK